MKAQRLLVAIELSSGMDCGCRRLLHKVEQLLDVHGGSPFGGHLEGAGPVAVRIMRIHLHAHAFCMTSLNRALEFCASAFVQHLRYLESICCSALFRTFSYPEVSRVLWSDLPSKNLYWCRAVA